MPGVVRPLYLLNELEIVYINELEYPKIAVEIIKIPEKILIILFTLILLCTR